MIRAIWFVPPPVVIVAEKLGILDRSGGGIEATRTRSSDEQFVALSEGTCDVAVTAMDNVMAWNQRPGDERFRIVAQIESVTPLPLMARNNIRSLADLENEDILVDAVTNGFVVALLAMLTQGGLSPGSYRLKKVGGVKERLDALLAGEGAATLLGPPFDDVASAAGYRSLGKVSDVFPAFPGQGLVARQGGAVERGAELAALITGLDRARCWADANPAAAREMLLAEGYGDRSVAAMIETWPKSLSPDREGIDLVIGQRLGLGFPGADVSYDDLVEKVVSAIGYSMNTVGTMEDRLNPYGLGTFSVDEGERFLGLVLDGRVTSLSVLVAQLGELDRQAVVSMQALLTNWGPNIAAIHRIVSRLEGGTVRLEWRPLDALRVHPPVDSPRQVFCTGANYRQHVIDLTIDMGVGPEGLDKDGLRSWAATMMDERATKGDPYVFTKPVTAVSGAYDIITLPKNTEKPDWEIELGVVIGKGGRSISRENALSHVAGYAIVNDITARDLIPRHDYKMIGTDWLRAKGQRGFLPFGPYIVPSDFIADPQKLWLRLSVGDKVMQDESSSDMIFDVARQIEYISSYAELLPGDLICTGSPAGNGTHYGRYLQDGDIMTAEIEGLGVQRALCKAA